MEINDKLNCIQDRLKSSKSSQVTNNVIINELKELVFSTRKSICDLKHVINVNYQNQICLNNSVNEHKKELEDLKKLISTLSEDFLNFNCIISNLKDKVNTIDEGLLKDIVSNVKFNESENEKQSKELDEIKKQNCELVKYVSTITSIISTLESKFHSLENRVLLDI